MGCPLAVRLAHAVTGRAKPLMGPAPRAPVTGMRRSELGRIGAGAAVSCGRLRAVRCETSRLGSTLRPNPLPSTISRIRCVPGVMARSGVVGRRGPGRGSPLPGPSCLRGDRDKGSRATPPHISVVNAPIEHAASVVLGNKRQGGSSPSVECRASSLGHQLLPCGLPV
jgi:hypothetical protein